MFAGLHKELVFVVFSSLVLTQTNCLLLSILSWALPCEAAIPPLLTSLRRSKHKHEAPTCDSWDLELSVERCALLGERIEIILQYLLVQQKVSLSLYYWTSTTAGEWNKRGGKREKDVFARTRKMFRSWKLSTQLNVLWRLMIIEQNCCFLHSTL